MCLLVNGLHPDYHDRLCVVGPILGGERSDRRLRGSGSLWSLPVSASFVVREGVTAVRDDKQNIKYRIVDMYSLFTFTVIVKVGALVCPEVATRLGAIAFSDGSTRQ
jgi:hypothetical protein